MAALVTLHSSVYMCVFVRLCSYVSSLRYRGFLNDL